MEQETLAPGMLPAVPSIHVSHDAIAGIVAQTAMDVEGVAELGGNLVSGLHDILGRHATTRGVHVDVVDGRVDLSVHLVVRYGVRIPDVAQHVQQQVKAEVEHATGLLVRTVDIHIQGVLFSDREGEE